MTQPKPNRPRGRPRLDEKSVFSENAVDPAAVELEVDEHTEDVDLLAKATQVLSGGMELSRNQAYKQRRKAKETAKVEDLQTTVVLILTLALSALTIPEDLKLNEDEKQAFAVPATRLLLRHVPLASKLSADAIDIIGMIGALSAYGTRTRAGWQTYREAKAAQATSPRPDDPFRFRGDVPEGL